jgi:hypothetical protein
MARKGDARPHPLDRPAARVVALAVFAAMAALLAFIHRDDLAGAPGEAPSPAAAAYRACLAERHAAIDGMVAEGVVDEARAALFKTRAAALCRDLADRP